MRIFIVFLSVFLFADVNIDIKTKTVDMDYKSTLFVNDNHHIKKFNARLFHKIMENENYYITEGDLGYSSYILLINKKKRKN